MTKRFGRNQKRKLNEQLKQANEMSEHYRKKYMNEIERGKRNAEIVEDTARVLGEKFITLDPQSVEVKELDSVINGWRAITNMSMKRMHFDNNDSSLSVETVCEVMLQTLYYSSNIDHFTGDIHHRFKFEDNTAAYAISKETMRNMPRDFIIRRIADECATLIVDGVKSAAIKRGIK